MRIPQTLKRFRPSRAQWIGGAIILTSGLIAYAAVPNTFTAGTPISASQVNANFADADTRIMTLETNPSIGGNLTLVPSTATTGNIMKGANPFLHNYGGSSNTFLGLSAGNFTMTGGANTAFGNSTLINNTTGSDNTASGSIALANNTTGSGNTASGSSALLGNTTGRFNTANGSNALLRNSTGIHNTASGTSALEWNSTGTHNTASGTSALFNNTTGSGNTAVGESALYSNTTGSNNIAIGDQAGMNLTTGRDNITIGHVGQAGNAGTIRIGTQGVATNAFIAGISDVGIVGGVGVIVNANGQLGIATSSRRFKDDIANMNDASSLLMKLRPVTFHYKSDQNPKGRNLQYGLIAEEVEKVAPSLVARNSKGEVETVYYQHLAPMLLNEYQKQQRIIQAQTDRLAALEDQAGEIAALKQQLAQVTAVLARMEKPEKIARAVR